MNQSEAGKKGAESFWKRFREDPAFRSLMVSKWKSPNYKHDNIVRAARAGGYALWRKYRSDQDFKSELDGKLAGSRSRGGSHSLRNLGEVGFKERLDGTDKHLPSRKYASNSGLKVRSKEELKVANALENASILYDYEPRFIVGDSAFYPDFRITGQNRIIEVAGYAGDRYWQRLARKIRLLKSLHPNLDIFVIASFEPIVKRYLAEFPEVTIFKWRDLETMISLCRD